MKENTPASTQAEPTSSKQVRLLYLDWLLWHTPEFFMVGVPTGEIVSGIVHCPGNLVGGVMMLALVFA